MTDGKRKGTKYRGMGVLWWLSYILATLMQ